MGGLIAMLSGCKPAQKAVQQAVAVLYGVPYATYDIRGKVVDERGKGVKDAQVVVKGHSGQLIGDTLLTDKKGRFEVKADAFPAQEITIVVSTQETQQALDSVKHTANYEANEDKPGFYRGECKIDTTIKLNDK